MAMSSMTTRATRSEAPGWRCRACGRRRDRRGPSQPGFGCPSAVADVLWRLRGLQDAARPLGSVRFLSQFFCRSMAWERAAWMYALLPDSFADTKGPSKDFATSVVDGGGGGGDLSIPLGM